MKWVLLVLLLVGVGFTAFFFRERTFLDRSRSPESSPGQPLPAVPSGSNDTRPAVFLTFDAGGNNGGVAKIREVLEREHIPATFFLTGRFIERYPDDARALAKLGPIGNHTYAHPHLPQLSFASASEEILKEETIAERLGIPLKLNFRFPYGESTPELVSYVEGGGYRVFGWTVDTAGWRGTSAGETVETIRERVKKKLGPEAIILMHVGSNSQDKSTLDADALPSVIEDIRAQGYTFRTLP